MPPRAILFDLDGTLVQTREASWKVFEETNRAFDLGVVSQEDFFRLFEDNLFETLRKRSDSPQKAQAAAAHFLKLLQSSYYPRFVPGMADVVKALAGTSALAVISSNSTATIRRILTAAGLAHCFSHVFGGDVEPDKRASVRRFLLDPSYSTNRDCRAAYREEEPPAPRVSDIVLITDTVGDVVHGVESGVRVIGVAWGMHTEEQLLAAGAEFVAVWPQELLARLSLGGFSAGACSLDTPSTCTGGGCGCPDKDSPNPHSLREVDQSDASAIRRRRAVAAANDRATRLALTPAELAPVAHSVTNRPPAVDQKLLRCLAPLWGPARAGHE